MGREVRIVSYRRRWWEEKFYANWLYFSLFPIQYSNTMKTIGQLSNRLKKLHEKRRLTKQPSPRTKKLTSLQRAEVLSKTDNRCHICGCMLKLNDFQADHIKSHISGGTSFVENFLPSCKTCNNYRWHYSPEEIQWMLKFGVFAKTQIENETKLGLSFADAFLKKEARKINRTT
jgi:hypothetical protein